MLVTLTTCSSTVVAKTNCAGRRYCSRIIELYGSIVGSCGCGLLSGCTSIFSIGGRVGSRVV